MRNTKLFTFLASLLLVGLSLTLHPGYSAAEEATLAPSPGQETAFGADYTPAPDQFFRGTVQKVTNEGTQEILGRQLPYQTVEVNITTGKDADKFVTIEHGTSYSIQPGQVVGVGDEVVVGYQETPVGSSYYIADRYRLPTLGWFAAFFLIVIALVSGQRGLKALLGLVFSFAVLIWFVVPQILAGRSPLVISLVAATVIGAVSLVFAHGRNRRTFVAAIATFVTLALAILAAAGAVALAHLTGLGSEDAYQLQFSLLQPLNYQGLLLGGMIIGVIGVLDDITAAQTTVVTELQAANPRLTITDLYRRGMNVGREHIASLVNTLVLAYAGVSLPIFFYFAVDQSRPIWLLINSEFLAEEIVRTLVGSLALVLAVPITTALAAWYFSRNTPSEQK
jgi:uncharacterized membrane protein